MRKQMSEIRISRLFLKARLTPTVLAFLLGAFLLGVFLLGVFLLCLNVLGVFRSLGNSQILDEPVRNADIYDSIPSVYRDVVIINSDQLLAATARKHGESDADYITRLAMTVHQGMADYWEDEGIDRYNLRVPASENYLLFVAGYILPKWFKKYEFANYRKAVERGVGYCSQQAGVLAGILDEQGIESRIVLFTRHTVSLARVGGRQPVWWIVDPDYGVIVKHDLAEVTETPELVKPFYLNKGYTDEHVNYLVQEVYGEKSYRVAKRASGYFWLRSYYEPLSYVLIWIIPILLMLPFSYTLFKGLKGPISQTTSHRL